MRGVGEASLPNIINDWSLWKCSVATPFFLLAKRRRDRVSGGWYKGKGKVKWYPPPSQAMVPLPKFTFGEI